MKRERLLPMPATMRPLGSVVSFLALSCVVSGVAGVHGNARAQPQPTHYGSSTGSSSGIPTDHTAHTARSGRVYDVPFERFSVSVRGGPYRPAARGFDDFFSRSELLWGVDFDLFLLRWKGYARLGLGMGAGWSKFKGDTFDGSGQKTDENSVMQSFPLTGHVTLLITALPTYLRIPLVVSVRGGVLGNRWRLKTGEDTSATGLQGGIAWAGRVGLDLNSLDPAAARRLREDWKIQRTYLFGEIMGLQGNSSPDLSDTTWQAGIAFTF